MKAKIACSGYFETVLFFLLTYVFTFVLAFLAMRNNPLMAVPPLAVTISAILYHWCPTLVGVGLTWARQGKVGLRSLLARLSDWRVGWRWYLFIFLFPLATHLSALGGHLLLGGQAPQAFDSGGMAVEVGNLLLFVPVFLGVLLQAGLAEEIGWRGYALPRLLPRLGALGTNLALGVVWWFWHFLPPGSWQAVSGRGLPFFLGTIAQTVILTWLFSRTRGSLLVAVLYHAAVNSMEWLAPISQQAYGGSQQPYLIHAAILWLSILFIVMIPAWRNRPQHVAREVYPE